MEVWLRNWKFSQPEAWQKGSGCPGVTLWDGVGPHMTLKLFVWGCHQERRDTLATQLQRFPAETENGCNFQQHLHPSTGTQHVCMQQKRKAEYYLYSLLREAPHCLFLEPKVICPHKIWVLVGHQLHDKKEAILTLSAGYLLSKMWMLDLQCFPWCFPAYLCLCRNVYLAMEGKKRNRKTYNVIFWGFCKVMQKLFPDQQKQSGVQDKTSSGEGKPKD